MLLGFVTERRLCRHVVALLLWWLLLLLNANGAWYFMRSQKKKNSYINIATLLFYFIFWDACSDTA